MLFDLRGRGRRRAIQVIYLTLALLMGGGLIFFGIGGNTSGGLFNAFNGNGSSTSADKVFEQRVTALEKRTQVNPRDAAAWVGLAKLHFQLAGGGGNFDQTQQAYTDKGRAELRRAASAWDRYLALSPPKPDASVAVLMTQALGPGGLGAYDKAVRAMEIVIDSRPPSYALYGQLSLLAHAAKQDRKSTLAEDKAVELAPKGQGKNVRASIDQAKTQLDQQSAAQPVQPQSG
jgi:tetratricopeptide (TPR) repeat protein